MTAGRGSSTSVGADTNERGRKEASRQSIGGVAEENAPANESMDGRSSAAPDVSVIFSVKTTETTEESANEKKNEDLTSDTPSNQPVDHSKPTNSSPQRNKSISPRKTMGIRKYPKKNSVPVVDVPWNSNVLVTKVRERMAEVSALEQEIAVKRRATEIKQRMEKREAGAHSDHEKKDNASGDNSENADESSSVEITSQKVSFKPEPPSDPRPSVPSDEKSGSYKSIKGRRQTGYVSHPPPSQDDEHEKKNDSKETSTSEKGASGKSIKGRRQTAFVRAPPPCEGEEDDVGAEELENEQHVATQQDYPSNDT